MTTDMDKSAEKQREEEAKKLIAAVYSRTLQMLQAEFEEFRIEGQMINQPNYGPMFIYRLHENGTGNEYACGFFINEMLEKHKDAGKAQQWFASFYIDMIDEGISKPLPKSPASPEENKKLLEGQIVPHCVKAVRDEFILEKVYVNLGMHKQAGPVLEAGFPAMKDGNNVCAMPAHYLLTLYLLNRDPAEPLVNGLYKIREEHGLL